MQHWKRTIEQANRCFNLGEWVEARELYLQALALAQVLFERWADPDEAVAACVISHHNLADLHLSLGQPEESAEYLCAIHQRLLQTLQDPRLPDALRQAALRHSNKTYAQLLSFISEHGEYPRTHRLLSSNSEPVRTSLQKSSATHHFHGVH
ncbi:tetratricopeptide repeat protein [Pseudomonas syringae]|nr:tetratricopeptide repeat protein [Pseudomonas syringae]MBD8573566.1 tetratricopeptide repeat protein [Pseudomonas syringae]MBD8789981.1 tetratricopeptide repeat protein [Pseudomonas syringae]MBD8799956.1 tetratricopeptide repeat protein [Pseudomonas syringae]MBD8811048.1 tetratricopeptide repeat protein [Pseudomonas syringae]